MKNGKKQNGIDNKSLKTVIFIAIAFSVSCSSNKELIRKVPTEFGTVKFYMEEYLDLRENNYKKSVLAKFQNSTYVFNPDEINKNIRNEKYLFHTLTFRESPKELKNTEYFQELSKIDSLILLKGDKILDSLKLNNYKKSKGATGFITIVVN